MALRILLLLFWEGGHGFQPEIPSAQSSFCSSRSTHRRGAHLAAVSTEAELVALSYRELQAECKALGLKAAGSKDVLRERLLRTMDMTPPLAETGPGGGGEGFWSPTSAKLLLESLGTLRVLKATGPMGKYILGKLSGSDILAALKANVASSRDSAESVELLSSLDPEKHVNFGFVNKIGTHPVKIALGCSGPTAEIMVEIVDGGEAATDGSLADDEFPTSATIADELEDILNIGDGLPSSGDSAEIALEDLGSDGADDFWESMGLVSSGDGKGATTDGAGDSSLQSADDGVLSALAELDAIDDPFDSMQSADAPPKSLALSGVNSILSSVFEDEEVSMSPEERVAEGAEAKADLIDASERGYFHSVVRAYKRWSHVVSLDEKTRDASIKSMCSGDQDDSTPSKSSDPDEVSVFKATLRSCQRGRLGKEAETTLRNLLEARRAAQDSISIEELNMVLSAHARGGNADQALRLLKNARQLYGLIPDVISFTTVIHALTAAGDEADNEAALRLVDEMRADPAILVEEDLTVLRLTVNAASRLGDWHRAQDELGKARRRPQEERMWDMASLYTSVMAALSVSREYQRLLDVFYMMEEDGVDPNGTGYGLAIAAAARLGWDRGRLEVSGLAFENILGSKNSVHHEGPILNTLILQPRPTPLPLRMLLNQPPGIPGYPHGGARATRRAIATRRHTGVSGGDWLPR